MYDKAVFIGDKRLVGVAGDGKRAEAERFEVNGKKGWMIFRDGQPEGIAPTWDSAVERLRLAGYAVKAEPRKN